MSYLDSPICRCELMRVMVLTDQTQAQCAEEHACPQGQQCPLCRYFVGEEVPVTIVPPAVKKKPRGGRG